MSVFILGMHRSGTSLVSSVLGRLGYHIGDDSELLTRNEANVQGYYERHDVRAANQQFITSAGLNWWTISALGSPRHPTQDAIDAYREAIFGVLTHFGPEAQWAIKDPRLSYLVPYWAAQAQDAAYIVCVRKPAAVIRSVHARNRLAPALVAAMWEHHTLAALANSPKSRRMVTIYEKLLADPEREIGELVGWLGRVDGAHISREALASATGLIQTGLDHSADADAEFEAVLTDSQKALYEMLAAGGEPDDVQTRLEHSPSAEMLRREAAHQIAKRTIESHNEAERVLREQLAERGVRIADLNEQVRKLREEKIGLQDEKAGLQEEKRKLDAFVQRRARLMSDMLDVMDSLLSPRGGRLFIPVRRIRAELVKLRKVVATRDPAAQLEEPADRPAID